MKHSNICKLGTAAVLLVITLTMGVFDALGQAPAIPMPGKYVEVQLTTGRPGPDWGREVQVEISNNSGKYVRVQFHVKANNRPGGPDVCSETGTECVTEKSGTEDIAPGGTASFSLPPFPPKSSCPNLECDNVPGQPEFCAVIAEAGFYVTAESEDGVKWIDKQVTICTIPETRSAPSCPVTSLCNGSP